MYGLAVNLIMSVSGHPSIINEIAELLEHYCDWHHGFDDPDDAVPNFHDFFFLHFHVYF